MAENGRLAEGSAALQSQVSLMVDTLAQLETRRVEDAKHTEEYQALSVLQINRLQDENSSLHLQVTCSVDKATKLEAKMAMDATALMSNLDELRLELESLTSSSMQDKETMHMEAQTLRSKISELVSVEEGLQKALSEKLQEQVLKHTSMLCYILFCVL